MPRRRIHLAGPLSVLEPEIRPPDRPVSAPVPRFFGWYILDATGTPLPCDDLEAWTRQRAQAGAWRIGRTCVGSAEVSTVFLGLDHSLFGNPPMLFETMIFGGDHSDWTDRYSTRAAATAGHATVVAWLEGRGPEPGTA